MGKITTIYLSDAEARRLKEFCDENQCTQYSALKTAVKQLLFKSIQREETPQKIIEEIPQENEEEFPEENPISNDEVEETIEQSEREETSTPDSDVARMRKLLRRLRNGKNTRE